MDLRVKIFHKFGVLNGSSDSFVIGNIFGVDNVRISLTVSFIQYMS
jgi:hypothetical protein